MLSLRARALLFLLQHRHWLRGQQRRENIHAATSLRHRRERLERGVGWFGTRPRDVTTTPAVIDGRSAVWVRPVYGGSDQVLLYFHGGGYVMGSSRSHHRIVAKFVRASGASALVFDYRLAPEHPFPAALDDAVATYRWLLSGGVAASRIVFVGDSAGGGLALATLLACRAAGDPLPAAAVTLSPWTDLAYTGASYAEPDPVAPAGSWAVYSSFYAGEADVTSPLLSPLYGDLAGLPPLLVYVGEREAMRDDATRFAAKAREAGVAVRLEVGAGLFHCYPVFAPAFPEATAAMTDIGAFVRAQVRPPLP